ncbi:MAG: hypothetical protein WAM60_09940 [Candidatus Promineifilaceae bacterium]
MKIPKKEEGQGLVEYALLLVLVAIVVIVILAVLGRTVRGVFAQVYAGLNGQALDGSGTEYVITGPSADAVGAPPNCTVTVSASVVVFEDGELAGAGVGVSGSASWPSGGGSISGTTDNNGVASVSTSGPGACEGTATITVGGTTVTAPYSN